MDKGPEIPGKEFVWRELLKFDVEESAVLASAACTTCSFPLLSLALLMVVRADSSWCARPMVVILSCVLTVALAALVSNTH